MRSQDSNPGFFGDDQLSDAWWATLAVCLLHPIQVQIIEVLRYMGRPLSLGDLSEIIDEVEWVNLDRHIGRLRRIGVLRFSGPQRADSVLDLRHELLDWQGPGRGIR